MVVVRSDGVERAVGADAAGLVDIERDAIGRAGAARDERRDVKIFLAEHGQVVERARDDGGDDDRVDIGASKAFELKQLHEPHGVLVGGTARVGRDPPPRADHCGLARTRPGLDQGKDKVGVSGIDGEQHQGALSRLRRGVILLRGQRRIRA